MERLESLDARGNRIVELGPLRNLAAWKCLLLDRNRIADVSVLLEMAERDRAGNRRFTPFWQVSLTGNPLGAAARTSQLAELRQAAKSVTFAPEP